MFVECGFILEGSTSVWCNSGYLMFEKNDSWGLTGDIWHSVHEDSSDDCLPDVY